MVQQGMVWNGMAENGMVQHGMVWQGMLWYGSFGKTWCGMGLGTKYLCCCHFTHFVLNDTL